MLKKFLIIFLIIFYLLPASLVSGQEVEETNGPTDFIELDLVQEVQHPKTGEFEYTLRVRTKIDSNRVRINWEIKEGFMKAATGTVLTDAVTVMKNKDYFITKRFVPLKAGFEEIKVSATAFGDTGDYFSYASQKFLINDDLQIAPKRDEYKVAAGLVDTLNALKIIFLGLNIFILISIILWRFKVWMESE